MTKYLGNFMKVLGEKSVPVTYMRVIEDTYNGVRTRITIIVGDIDDFPIDIGLHQISTLSPFLFTIVMDELTRGIQHKIP